MRPAAPVRVVLSAQAADRARSFGVSARQIEDELLGAHSSRRSNPESADWLIRTPSLGIAYNWPSGGDATLAVVVTVWRRR